MEDDLDLARTLEAVDPELARTLVKEPRRTIVPESAPPSEIAALTTLRLLGASVDGRIALHRTLGEGGMGVVHLATQATIGRHVAVKTLRAGHGDAGATLRILREAWVTGALEHPNVVPVYDIGLDAAGAPVIVMKRIEGRAWADLVHAPDEIARRFGAADALEWNLRTLASVCNAVDFAHSRGILHRDLKPENVMIGAFGEVYVLDWGLAVSTRDDPSGRLPPAAEATEVAGTPCYMAPEMLLGGGPMLSPRTDVYLLGAIFYEICAGAPPHQGASVMAMFSSVLTGELRFPEGFPAEARAICQKALSRDPAARHESAGALRAAIEDYLRHRGSRKLAWEAKRSLHRLLHAIEHEPPGEDRTLAVFNLLGECRFGYRAALSAWPENEAARRDLDRALLAVIGHELEGGDPLTAATLLREVEAAPPDLPARIEAATRARAEQDARLRRLEADHDPRIGTRTRTFIGAVFGSAWMAIPLVGFWRQLHGEGPTYTHALTLSGALLLLGLAFFAWARETLTKTQFNRRIAATLAAQLTLQMVLAAGAYLAGISPAHLMLLLLFTFSLTEGLMAIWVERWFALPAVAAVLAFLVAAARPDLVFPAMSAQNLVFTVVLVRFWFPRDTLAKMMQARDALRKQARRWLEEGYGAPAGTKPGALRDGDGEGG
jgi:serine/threonine-protein kinase